MLMEVELEAKFLGVDPATIRKRLKVCGATCAYPERLMKRKVFDFPDNRLHEKQCWLRVRDEGNAVTMSIKQQRNTSLHGTTDRTISVSDFDATCALLISLGLVEKSYQETKRELWTLNDAEVTIDTWPWIPSFVEIEAPHEGLLRDVVATLGFLMSSAVHGGVASGVYERYLDVGEHVVNLWPVIRFEDPCPWPQKSVQDKVV